MKKLIYCLFTVILISAAAVINAFAVASYVPKIAFEDLYQELAVEIGQSGQDIDAMIMTDMNRDGIPELLTLSSSDSEDEWEKFELLVERGYYVDYDESRTCGGATGLPIGDKIVESSPWRDDNDSIPINQRITINNLKTDAYEFPTETFFVTRKENETGIECLTTYNIDGAKGEEYRWSTGLQTVWFEDDGFKFKVGEYTQDYFDDYSETDIICVYVRLSNSETGEKMSVTSAMSFLLDEFVEEDKNKLSCSKWAKDELYEAKRLGIISNEILEWDMTEEITRAEFTKLIMNYCIVRDNGNFLHSKDESANIVDIASNPYKESIEYAYKQGYVKGTHVDASTGEIYFSPNDLITREQLATMIHRAEIDFFGTSYVENDVKTDYDMTVGKLSGYIDENGFVVLVPNKSFRDAQDISDYAKTAVYTLNSHEIIEGILCTIYSGCWGNGDYGSQYYEFQPQGTATRQEAVLMVLRTYKTIYESADN